jgi:hypothetical protein
MAQEKVEISPKPPPVMVVAPESIKEVGKAQALYDWERNRTMVMISPLEVHNAEGNNIRMRAGFILSGKGIAKPPNITLTFFSYASERTYADDRALKIFLDGKEVLSSVAHYLSGNKDGKVYVITVTQEIPYEMFLRLINSKSIKMRIGPTEFELKQSDIEALRDLNKIIE